MTPLKAPSKEGLLVFKLNQRRSMDWNIDFSSISDWMMSHSTVVIISVIAFFILFLIYLSIINRQSLSDKRMAELLKEDLYKNKKKEAPEGLGKKISKTHGMPRFFQEHKKMTLYRVFYIPSQKIYKYYQNA